MKKAEDVIINQITMSCAIVYENSKIINLVILLILVGAIFTASIYTFIRCLLHFRAYPESLTDKLLCMLISPD